MEDSRRVGIVLHTSSSFVTTDSIDGQEMSKSLVWPLLWLSLFLPSLLSTSSSLSSDNGLSSNDSSDAKLRFGRGERRDHREVHRIYLRGEESRYGDSLPSFAYDFSELFLGAVVERSLDSDDLHLSMILLGKKTIHLQDEMISPFKSVSTDINTIEMWTKASDSPLWAVGSSRGSDYSGSSASTNSSSPHNHWSGLSCRLQNEKRSSPYITSAAWVPSDMFTNVKHSGMIEVLRCRLKFSHHAYRVLALSDEYLTVDIVRRHSAKQQGHNVMSFAVPWRTRHVGYGLRFVNGTSLFDPWQYRETQKKQYFVFVPSIFDITKAVVPSSNVAHTEKDVLQAIPKIIVFIEYYTTIGVAHIFINVPLSTESPLMKTIHQTLSHYIDSGLITLVTTAMSGVDGASGFLGLIFKDWFVENIVQTSLLYLTKGLASHVIKLSLLDYIAFTDANITTVHQMIAKYQPPKNKRDKNCFYSLESSEGRNDDHYWISTKYNGFLYNGVVGACRAGHLFHQRHKSHDIDYLASVNMTSASDRKTYIRTEDYGYTQYNQSISSSVAVIVHVSSDLITRLDNVWKKVVNNQASNISTKQIAVNQLPLFLKEVQLQGRDNFLIQFLLSLHESSLSWKEGMWMNETNVNILYESLKEISHQPSKDSTASKLAERLRSLPDFDGSNTTTNEFELFDSKTDSFIGTAIRWEDKQIVEPFFRTVKPPLSKMIKEIL